MTLANILDWFQTMKLADHYYANRLDNKQEMSIGVYEKTVPGSRPVMAIGGPEASSYDIMSISVLIHWNRSFPQTEAAAQALWNTLIQTRHADIPGGQHIYFLQMTVPKPVYVSTDETGIHEYVINFNLYYRR